MAKTFITKMHKQGLVKYAAFSKEASNCSRFVTDALIASVTDISIKKRLIKSNRFTPSTVGNVTIANTKSNVYVVCEKGVISKFLSTPTKENVRCFLDRLNGYQPELEGNIHPKQVNGIHKEAQWLEGVGVGAWFELHATSLSDQYRYRRISPYGNIDVEGLYRINDKRFSYEQNYKFVHYSNCAFYHIEQNGVIYRFDLIKTLS